MYYDVIGRKNAVPTVLKSLRIPQKTINGIRQIAKESGKEFSTVTNELLEEAVRMQRCPGIIFSEGTAGRRARIAGTGIEVWEVIATFKSVKRNFKRLHQAYHWLSEQQLMCAVGYYKAYSEDINHLLKQNEELTRKRVYEKYPFLVRGNR